MSFKNYFQFTRTDLKGIISLIIILILLLAGPAIIHLLMNGENGSIDYKDIKAESVPAADSLLTYTNSENSHAILTNADSHPVLTDTNLHPVLTDADLPNAKRLPSQTVSDTFDPNTAAPDKWAGTGLAGYKINIILHYLEKGGRFHRAADLEKIYSLTADECRRIEPRLIFNNQQKLNLRSSSLQQGPQPRFGYSRNEPSGYRSPGNRLLRTNSFIPARGELSSRKISLNTADYSELRMLPELSTINISAIIRYRERNGNFTSVAELKNIGILSSHTFARVKPFLKL